MPAKHDAANPAPELHLQEKAIHVDATTQKVRDGCSPTILSSHDDNSKSTISATEEDEHYTMMHILSAGSGTPYRPDSSASQYQHCLCACLYPLLTRQAYR